MKFCVIVICSFVFPATKMMTVIGSSTKASKASCSKSSKSKSGKSDSNNGCNTESLFFQHAVPDETVSENVFEASSIEEVPNLVLPNLGGGNAAPTIGTSIAPTAGGGTLAGTTLPPGTIAPTTAIAPGTIAPTAGGGTLAGMTSSPGTIAPTTAITLPDTTAGSTLSPIIGTLVEMSMSMPDLGGSAALTIGGMSMSLGDDVALEEAEQVVPNNDFEPLMMSMSLSMPSVEELTRVSDIDTTIEDEDGEENGEGFIENIKNATDAGTEFLQNVTNKVQDLFNGTETDNEVAVEDDNMTSSAGTVAADYRVCRQVTAAVASLIVMVVVVVV